jgi:hypothetical protein
MLCPMLRPFATLPARTSQHNEFGYLPAHLPLDNFTQGNVCGPEMSDVSEERPARSSTASIQLADAPRNQVHQDVGVNDYRQRLFD